MKYPQKERKELAALYRTVRRDNPAMARLLRRRFKSAVDKLASYIFNSATDHGGLAELLK